MAEKTIQKTVTCLNGPVGSGKTAIPGLIKLLYRVPITVIGVGNLLREAQENSKLDKTNSDKMNAGILLDSDFVWPFIQPYLPTDRSFFIDGFPRRPEQVPMILKWCQENNYAMIYVNITQSYELTKTRLSQHKPKRLARADSAPEVFDTRWQQYETLTIPVYEELKRIKDGQKAGFDVPLEIVIFDSNQIINYEKLFNIYVPGNHL